MVRVAKLTVEGSSNYPEIQKELECLGAELKKILRESENKLKVILDRENCSVHLETICALPSKAQEMIVRVNGTDDNRTKYTVIIEALVRING